MISSIFGIVVAAFLVSGFVWTHFALKATREKRWGLALIRALAAAVSFGAVVFEFVVIGALLQ